MLFLISISSLLFISEIIYLIILKLYEMIRTLSLLYYKYLKIKIILYHQYFQVFSMSVCICGVHVCLCM